LLLLVILAITITAYTKIPVGFALPVHWGPHGQPDWLWPKETALTIAPIAGVALIGFAAAAGRVAPLNQIEAGGHVVRVALSGVLALLAAIQTGLFMIGIGSDIDIIRMVSGGMAVFLVILGNELRSAKPQPYAGLRLPWTLHDPRHWTIAHQVTGAMLMLGGLTLGFCAWLWPDPGTLIVALGATVVAPVVIGAVVSQALARSH
jgi:uncharacterized membrane protein